MPFYLRGYGTWYFLDHPVVVTIKSFITYLSTWLIRALEFELKSSALSFMQNWISWCFIYIKNIKRWRLKAVLRAENLLSNFSLWHFVIWSYLGDKIKKCDIQKNEDTHRTTDIGKNEILVDICLQKRKKSFRLHFIISKNVPLFQKIY